MPLTTTEAKALTDALNKVIDAVKAASSTSSVTPTPTPNSTPTPAAPTKTTPVVSFPRKFFVDGGSAAAAVKADRDSNYASISKADVDAVDAVLAKDAQGIWINGPGDLPKLRDSALTAATRGEALIVVIYFIPDRDGHNPDSWSAGGVNSKSIYFQTIDAVRKILADSGVFSAVIVEPDALTQPDTLTQDRIDCLNYALSLYAGLPRTMVAIDAGGANWRTSDFMLARLRALTLPAGVLLSSNVSGFHGVTPTLAYIAPIAKALNRKVIIDSSRNGVDVLGDDWSNDWVTAQGPVRQGVPSQLVDGDSVVAALLHVKRAGESDGDEVAAGAWYRWWAVMFSHATQAAPVPTFTPSSTR